MDDDVLDDLLADLPPQDPDNVRAARLRDRCKRELTAVRRQRAKSAGAIAWWTVVESASLALTALYLAAVVQAALHLSQF